MTFVSFLRRLGLLAALAVLLVLPASASALQLHIVNESGRPSSEVFVDIAGVAGPGEFEVPGFLDDQPRALSEIPGQEATIDRLISGRVYVSYGAPVQEGVTLSSPTRFDWAELTVTPAPADAANLTAVNQFAIGMRLTTLGAGGEALESVGSTYADTIFAALQGIPGGPESTVRAADGEVLRVLSPDNVGSAYPLLTEYVDSMQGQTITLHTPFFKPGERTTSEYTGTFGAEGAITLNGTKRVEGGAVEPAPPILVPAGELVGQIYTGGNTPNTFEGAVRRDLLAGFSLGLWGGRYGNDAIDFCTDRQANTLGEWCPHFDVPAFAEARTTPAPFPAYEQYAAVIDQYADVYGNPYSDASKKVTVVLDQSRVKTLQLTILPDSPPVPSPATPGDSTGRGPASASPGPAKASSPGPAPTPASEASFKRLKRVKLVRDKLKVGTIDCEGACGRIVATLRPRKGKGVLAGETVTVRSARHALVLKPTKRLERLLAHRHFAAAKLTVTVTQPGRGPTQVQSPLRVLG
ncbi:MAG: hypothetical protein JST59_03180 [Actinobacteria bacterium]|nr:hypothetical protein [Actinomycetota bacterium]